MVTGANGKVGPVWSIHRRLWYRRIVCEYCRVAKTLERFLEEQRYVGPCGEKLDRLVNRLLKVRTEQHGG